MRKIGIDGSRRGGRRRHKMKKNLVTGKEMAARTAANSAVTGIGGNSPATATFLLNALLFELTIIKRTTTISIIANYLSVQEERERYRLKEKERALRIEERRRQIERERQREIERRQRDEAIRLER